MTPGPNELKAALQRLIDGNAGEADRDAVRMALNTGVLVTGERAVAIGGNASDVIITTGDQNIVFSFKGADADAVSKALSSIAPTRLHEAPRPPADFTGREDELKELLAAIEAGGVTISGLQGMGGIGKTVLALKLVELLKPRYSDAQFFLDLKGVSTQPLTVAEALAHVVRAYHPVAQLPESESELRGLYLSVLDGQRALLLMDNAATAAQVEPLIPPAGCLLLVTSRQHFTVPGLAAKNLDTLRATDARDLLLTIAPRIETQAEEIAARCGYLPLALRLAATAMVTYRNLSPADYVRRLRDRQQRLQLINASLSLSYELLSDALRERWRWLAVFPDTFAGDAAAAVWQVKVDQAQDILGELMATSMVEWNETSGRYRLHDLGRLFADAKLSAEERPVGQKRFATHYRNVLAAVDDLYNDNQSLRRRLHLVNLEWGNIRVSLATAEAKALGWATLGLASTELGKIRRAIQVLEQGNALDNVVRAYDRRGENRRALQFYEQALLIHRKVGDRNGEGNDLWYISLTLDQLGERAQAIQHAEQALTIFEQIEASKAAKVRAQLADWREQTNP